MPNASPRLPTSVPMEPAPTMPSVLPGAVGDEHATSTGGFHVDGVHPGTGPDDQSQRGGALDERGRHLGASHDEDRDLAGRLDQRRTFQSRLKADLQTELSEDGDV